MALSPTPLQCNCLHLFTRENKLTAGIYTIYKLILFALAHIQKFDQSIMHKKSTQLAKEQLKDLL